MPPYIYYLDAQLGAKIFFVPDSMMLIGQTTVATYESLIDWLASALDWAIVVPPL